MLRNITNERINDKEGNIVFDRNVKASTRELSINLNSPRNVLIIWTIVVCILMNWQWFSHKTFFVLN